MAGSAVCKSNSQHAVPATAAQQSLSTLRLQFKRALLGCNPNAGWWAHQQQAAKKHAGQPGELRQRSHWLRSAVLWQQVRLQERCSPRLPNLIGSRRTGRNPFSSQLAHKVQQRQVAEQVLLPSLNHAQSLAPAAGKASRHNVMTRQPGNAQHIKAARAQLQAGPLTASRRQASPRQRQRRRYRLLDSPAGATGAE